MRKSIMLLTLIMISIILFGCSSKASKEFTKTCELTSSDVTNGYKLESVYKIYGTGDIVDKVVTTETVTTDNEDTLNYFNEYLSTSYESYDKSYGGYDNEITIETGKLISKTTIDYTKMDLKKFVEDNSVMKDYVKSDGGILLDGVVSIYESLGATCK